MLRREFLKAGLLTVSSPAPSAETEPSCLPDGGLSLSALEKVRSYLQYAIPDYIDDDWSENELVSAVSETVDLVCYAYGELDEAAEEIDYESGFLSRVPEFDLDGLNDNEDFYDWILERFSGIASFVAEMDIFPDGLANELEKFDPNLRKYTAYIPFAWALKNLLDTGCTIHRRFEKEQEVEPSTYISFCKYTGLFLIECLLLLVGSSTPYRVAFKATGKVNQAIIKHIGQNIGWTLYSWLLSGIHWCIRIVFSESIDQGISVAVKKASEGVVDDFEATVVEGKDEVDGVQSLSKPCVQQTVEYQVRDIVHYQNGITDVNYQLWKSENWLDQQIAQAEQRVESVQDIKIQLPF